MATPADTPLTAEELVKAIAQLPDFHALRRPPESYQTGFVAAFLKVYGSRRNSRAILQHKFSVPDSRSYSDEAFVQSAAELSAAHHVAQAAVTDWDVDKKVNPGNGRDVDVWYRAGPSRVALEVKCPKQELVSPDRPLLLLGGRLPGKDAVVDELQTVMRGATALPADKRDLQLAKHKDLRLKDAMVSAHDKFAAAKSLDELNVLLVAVGDEFLEWLNYLYENEGLFTPQSFWPRETFARTQVVMLSNLRYIHTACVAHHDWTLKNVFLLPCLNPAAESFVAKETVQAGLGVFDHHLKSFGAYRPRSTDPKVPDYVMNMVRVNAYIHDGLSPEEFARFFPCTTRRPARKRRA